MGAYVIVKKVGTWSGETAWALMPGRRYKSRQAAEAALERMHQAALAAAREGRCAPSWADSFRQHHAVLEIGPEDDCRSPLRRAGLSGMIVTTGTLKRLWR